MDEKPGRVTILIVADPPLTENGIPQIQMEANGSENPLLLRLLLRMTEDLIVDKLAQSKAGEISPPRSRILKVN